MAVRKQPETLADKLAAIVAAAPALRQVGVTSVGGDVPFTLAPPEPPAPRGPPPPAIEDDVDLADLDAFRKRADGAVS